MLFGDHGRVHAALIRVLVVGVLIVGLLLLLLEGWKVATGNGVRVGQQSLALLHFVCKW